MHVEIDLEINPPSPLFNNLSTNHWKNVMLPCFLAVMFITFSLEVTSIILSKQIRFDQTINSTSICKYTEDFQLSETNKLKLCVMEETLQIEIERFKQPSGSRTSKPLLLSDKEWNKLKSISNEYLLICNVIII